MSTGPSLNHLVTRFREDAVKLREYGDQRMALVCEQHADAVVQAIEEEGELLLCLQEASRISGYSVDHLGRLIRQGQLCNAGRRNAPAIRRQDLPLKPGHGVSTAAASGWVASPSEIARSVLHPGGRDA